MASFVPELRQSREREHARDRNPAFACFLLPSLPSSPEKLAEGSIFFPERHDDDKSPLMNDKRRRDFCNFIRPCVGQERSYEEADTMVARIVANKNTYVGFKFSRSKLR